MSLSNNYIENNIVESALYESSSTLAVEPTVATSQQLEEAASAGELLNTADIENEDSSGSANDDVVQQEYSELPLESDLVVNSPQNELQSASVAQVSDVEQQAEEGQAYSDYYYSDDSNSSQDHSILDILPASIRARQFNNRVANNSNGFAVAQNTIANNVTDYFSYNVWLNRRLNTHTTAISNMNFRCLNCLHILPNDCQWVLDQIKRQLLMIMGNIERCCYETRNTMRHFRHNIGPSLNRSRFRRNRRY